MSRAEELLEQATAGKIDRRRFLYLTGALAGTAAFSQLRADLAGASPRLNDYPFKLGVASGDPLPDEVVLWTRLAPSPFEADGGMPSQKVPVRWRVATDENMRRVGPARKRARRSRAGALGSRRGRRPQARARLLLPIRVPG
jgi:phosphodiesterase/alkaline phosphatase D-like protein